MNPKQIEKEENAAARKKLEDRNKDDKKINTREREIKKEKVKTEETKQKAWMEKWMKGARRKTGKSTEKIENIETDEGDKKENTEHGNKIQKLAEVFGGTDTMRKEKEIKEKVEEDMNREKAEKSKKVREKRELFERIADKKKKDTDFDETKLKECKMD